MTPCPPTFYPSARKEIARHAVTIAVAARLQRISCDSLPSEADTNNAIDFGHIAVLADRIATRNATRPALFPIFDDAGGAP